MRRKFLLLALVPLAALAAGGGVLPAAELDAEQVLQRLQRWLDETRDLESRFEQTLVSGSFGEGLEESGRLFVQRPGRMRWDYTDPEIKVAVVDGDRTRLYLAEEEQLWEGRLDEADSLLPTLLAGERPLADIFDAALLADPASGRGPYRLRLAPRTGAESFEEVVLDLHPPQFALREVEVLDPAGNRMRYRFSRIQRNRGLSAAVFRFEPPPGTEIVVTDGAFEEP